MRFLLALILLLGQSAYAQQMVLVFLHFKSDKPEIPKEQVDKIMEGYFANIKKMANDGKLLVAGPFEGGGGIFIFNSKSVDDVYEWFRSDPGVKSNRWDVEILPFQSRTGKPMLVKEPFEMTSYQFVRFTSYVAKFNLNDLPDLMRKHNNHLAEIKNLEM